MEESKVCCAETCGTGLVPMGAAKAGATVARQTMQLSERVRAIFFTTFSLGANVRCLKITPAEVG